MAEPGREPRRRTSRNRARILEAAMGCFAADPDASMDDVAQAAGVVRRTVYAHFPSREALVDGIAEEAAAALAAAVDRPDPEEPDLALAVAALMTWPVGDRFRVLLSFARKEVGDERIGELIAPLRTRTLAIVERGRRSGVFSAYLPPVVLVGMLEGLTMATLEQANRGMVHDAGESVALAALVLMGVPPERAVAVVQRARRTPWDQHRAPAPGGNAVGRGDTRR
ncbi:TetR family transcriptional regulator [Rhodococcus ruber Chol-4]|uniref:TetR family transcriptional regulator n=2 Tax=Rhodococcus TaxID=1827 RepID=A0A098BWA9_9NOCA|nr:MULTISPECIES: TetR/AcrR family transcriptional regulator [Rhodococcus]MDO2380978.1 TetR family transcriptional regulator [Rhodococcus ruber]NGR06107.1 helix-turn-helix transcriptional regulator [bacterium SGD-2]ATQ31807.1 TetR family transcriptional regulator [Rhodococcus ruber]AUM19865.1 TetR family transcriptional regulator [Rhodococcus ruber]AWH01727.1 TetR family transcriptional regulator [Rhodococcus ruber]